MPMTPSGANPPMKSTANDTHNGTPISAPSSAPRTAPETSCLPTASSGSCCPSIVRFSTRTFLSRPKRATCTLIFGLLQVNTARRAVKRAQDCAQDRRPRPIALPYSPGHLAAFHPPAATSRDCDSTAADRQPESPEALYHRGEVRIRLTAPRPPPESQRLVR